VRFGIAEENSVLNCPQRTPSILGRVWKRREIPLSDRRSARFVLRWSRFCLVVGKRFREPARRGLTHAAYGGVGRRERARQAACRGGEPAAGNRRSGFISRTVRDIISPWRMLTETESLLPVSVVIEW
jgi:hypothetical protein